MESKTGKLQCVYFSDPHLLQFMWPLINEQGRNQRKDLLFPYSYASFAIYLEKTLYSLGLQDVGYTLHSLRHGKATHDFLLSAPFDDIMSKGRWL